MADNRMYIRCKECKEYYALGKLFIASGWYTPFVDDFEGGLNAFLEEHHVHSGFSHVAEPYEIAYENTSDINNITKGDL